MAVSPCGDLPTQTLAGDVYSLIFGVEKGATLPDHDTPRQLGGDDALRDLYAVRI